MTKELEQQITELQSINAKYQKLYHSTPEMFFALDSKNIIFEVNSFAAKTLGYTIPELLGKSVLMLFDEGLHQRVTEQIDECQPPQKKHIIGKFKK